MTKNIILSKNAWEWIEDENDLNILKKIGLIGAMEFNRNIYETTT